MAIDRFETKRGECRIEDDTLVLDGSIRQQIANQYRGYWKRGGWMGNWFFVSIVFAYAWVLLFPVVLALTRQWAVLAALGVALCLVIVVPRAINRWRSFTRRSRIPLDAIDRVTLERGSRGLTRPRFVLTYEDGGETHHRYVMLPSTFVAGCEATIDTAIAVFDRHGFDVA